MGQRAFPFFSQSLFFFSYNNRKPTRAKAKVVLSMRLKKYHLNIAEYPTELLVKIVADLLISIVKENDKLSNQSVTHFHSRTVPPIGIYAYLSRILKFTSFSNEALLSTLIYFDRIAQHKGLNYAVNSLTVHRLLITR